MSQLKIVKHFITNSLACRYSSDKMPFDLMSRMM